MAGRTASARRTQKRYNSTNSMRQMYVYGNAVTKPAYEQEMPAQRPEKKKSVSGQVRKNRKNALRLNKGYVVFLSIAAVLALIVCVNYVKLQSQITTRSKNITAMQEELAAMREENTTKYNVLMDSVTLEEVEEKAINELGMVSANEDQIVEYENSAGDYVKQYEEIPEDGVVASSKDVQN